MNHLRVGGAERQLVLLAGELVAHGDEVRLYSLLPTEAYAEQMAELGVPIVELRGGRVRSVAFIMQTRRLLKEFAPDVVISFLYQANIVARVAGRLAGARTIISSIRAETFGGRGRELAMRFTDRLATVTTTNSALARDTLMQRRVSRRAIRVVPNGVDVDTYVCADATARASTRASLRVGDDEFLWLAAGRLAPQKDYGTMLDAFALHRRAHPESRLAIAGDGEQHDELIARALRLGLGDSVAFLGVRSDVPALLCAADAFVLSSAFEGLPNVVMEAMAAARPVVATRVGGVAELVDDPVTGTIVPPSDASSLAQAMDATAALPPAERAGRGERAKVRIARDWSTAAAGARWLALIDECAGA